MAVYQTETDFLQSLKRFNALFSRKYEWQSGISEQEHSCEYGHTIPAETLYFKKYLDAEGSRKLRVCKDCMEKMVYIIVDSDSHTRHVTRNIYRERIPKQKKIDRMLVMR